MIIFALCISSCTTKMLRLTKCNKYSAYFTKITKNKRLIGGTSILLNDTNGQKCSFSCLKNMQCKTMSLKISESLCHLHYDERHAHGTKLRDALDWVFVEADHEEKNVGAYFLDTIFLLIANNAIFN